MEEEGQVLVEDDDDDEEEEEEGEEDADAGALHLSISGANAGGAGSGMMGLVGLSPSSSSGGAIGEPSVGMEFPSDAAAKEYYAAYAARVGFAVRMNKSRRSRKDDSVIMRRFVCTREGFHSHTLTHLSSDPARKKRRRATSREGCLAMIEVIKKDPSRWLVSKLITHHTHAVAFPPAAPRPHHLPPPGSSGLLVAEPTNGFPDPKNVNRGAIRVNPFGGGEGGEAQGLLEYLRRMQAESPAFFYAIQVDNNNCMTNVFWADARARMAYGRFGDAVTFDTTYKKTKYMMPFAAFRGINHHLQSINFGCCLLMDETKGSYIWLLETWLAAMGGRCPDLLITDRDKAMEGAIARVFPNVQHRFCQWHILSRCKQKLSDVYLKHATLKADLKECISGSETVEDFETRWEYVLDKYNLRENAWLQALYRSRQQWAPVYQKERFFPELLTSQKSESLNKFFKTNFNMKTSLLLFITRFDQAMASCYEKEAQADFVSVYLKPPLKTPSPIEKQAASVYTRAAFDIFQEEFIESLGYNADNIEDGTILKYNVAKEEENGRSYMVTFDQSDKKARCTCCKFEYSGILCRHVLRIFFMVGVRNLPEECIIKRWTMNAVTSVALDERVMEPGASFPECLVAWYDDLCHDAIRYGMEGAAMPDLYKVAKIALQKAFTDVLAAKNMQRNELQNTQRFARQQNTQYKMPLPKLQHKRTPGRIAQQDAVGKNKKTTSDASLDSGSSGLNGDSHG